MMTNNKNINFEEILHAYSKQYFSLLPERLYSAINYALFSGGKRIRPSICFLSAEFVNVEISEVVDFAIAIEFIHTYSLIHDDMPCMDNDDFRRGKLTVHKAFGETTALLAGDALLNTAFEILLNKSATDSIYVNACKFIATCSGSSGMILGQALELFNTTYTEESIVNIALNKTGKLISAAIMSPALLSGDSKKINALSIFSKCVGLNFQITDDWLDEEKNESNSFLTVIGKEKTYDLLRKTNELAMKSLKPWGEKSQNLIEFSNKIFNRINTTIFT